jgi:4-carboxymuconolactone decarboxylase
VESATLHTMTKTNAEHASDARRRGLALLEQLHGGHAGEELVAEMREICPAFAELTIDCALGTIMARPGLDLRTRELVLLVACVMLGHAAPQVQAHAEAALRLGATREQLLEAVLQLTFYASGPAIRSALIAVHEVAEAHAEPH